MSSRRDSEKANPAKAAPYSGFAAIYDQIMAGVDYEGWVDYVESLLQHFEYRPQSVIDLACGTGSSTLPLAARGYRASGIDLSGEMLQLARAKAARAELTVGSQDLRSHRGKTLIWPSFSRAGSILLGGAFCAFAGVRKLLSPGLFIFDDQPWRRNESLYRADGGYPDLEAATRATIWAP